jgi:hypothetical protein
MLKKEKNKLAEQAEKRKKSEKLANSLRACLFSPTFNVIALVLLLLAVIGGLRIYRNQQTPGAQIKFVERGSFNTPDEENSENGIYPAPEIFKGEVYDTTERLRETGALGMAISLAVFAEFSEQGSMPPNLEKIWAFIRERNLMPPGLKFENGELLSPSSAIMVRYQSAPLRFEILSRPKQEYSSPAILLRFPLNRLDGKTITYFQSASTSRFDIPAPFAPMEKIVSAGWTIQQWRGELVPKDENAVRYLEEEKRLLDQLKRSQ